MTGRPLVLLVDDDASIRRLVELALEELPIELQTCASVADARVVLRARSAKLVITDLMMPGESGFDLLEQMAADPGLRAGAKLAVFSAGLTGPTRARLAELDVWRELDKPVSMAALEACVVEALAPAPGQPALHRTPGQPALHRTPGQPVPHRTPGQPALQQAPAGAEGRGADERRAIEQGFGGDVVLYTAFRSQALVQFEADRQEGDQAVRAADWPALHRLAHSLKGVLALLGHEQPAARARALESAAERRDAEACRAGWAGLRDALPRPIDER